LEQTTKKGHGWYLVAAVVGVVIIWLAISRLHNHEVTPNSPTSLTAPPTPSTSRTAEHANPAPAASGPTASRRPQDLHSYRYRLWEGLKADYALPPFETFARLVENSRSRKALYSAVYNDFDLGAFSDYETKIISDDETSILRDISLTPSSVTGLKAIPNLIRRLPNGTILVTRGAFDGNSELTLENGTEMDALVRLMSEGVEKEMVYVRASKKKSIARLPEGTYVLKTAFGLEWDSTNRRFKFEREFSESETFQCTEKEWNEEVSDGTIHHVEASKLRITLHKVLNGNFQSHDISESEFWR